MPKTKVQGMIFGIIMAYAMTIGMELYNTVWNMGTASLSAVVLHALSETLFMGIIVIAVSSLWGNRIGAAFAAKHSDPRKDNPYFCQLLRQAGTIAFMCLVMSLVATLLFQVVLGGASMAEVPGIWVSTLMRNFPMAFFWNMFAAAPFTHWLAGRIFREERVCVLCALPFVEK